ncbi:MAG: hypothetical protein EXS10_04375 [Phycisphaerales bacterium]|nr:hypothetical protein [Phycisphaerales bacterium]
MARIIDIGYWISLTAWFAVALAGGLAAAAIFPTARQLPISMEGYEGFLAAEPELGRTLIAGFLAQSVFALTSRAQMILLPVFVIMVLLQNATGIAPSAWRNKLGRLALCVAAGATAISLFWSMPMFDQSLEAYRSAARGGDVPAAMNIKVTLDEYHSYSTMLGTTTLLAILVIVLTSSLSAPFRRKRDGASHAPRFVGVSGR